MLEKTHPVVNDARITIDNFKRQVAGSTKKDLPKVVEIFETKIINLLDQAINEPATIISGTADIRQRGKTDILTPKEKSSGTSNNTTVAVRVSMGLTENLGDFRSARADISVERRVPDTEKDIKAGINSANIIAGNEIQDTINQIADYMKNSK